MTSLERRLRYSAIDRIDLMQRVPAFEGLWSQLGSRICSDVHEKKLMRRLFRPILSHGTPLAFSSKRKHEKTDSATRQRRVCRKAARGEISRVQQTGQTDGEGSFATCCSRPLMQRARDGGFP